MAKKKIEDIEVTETEAPAVEVTETEAPAVEVAETEAPAVEVAETEAPEAPAVEDEAEPNVLENALDAIENVVESGFEYAEGFCKKTLDVFFGRTKHVEPE